MKKTDLQRVIKLFFDQEKVFRFDTFSEGEENTNILVELKTKKFVVRLMGKEHSIIGRRKDSDIEFELELIQFFHSNGLPVANIIHSKNDRLFEKIQFGNEEVPVMVFEYIDGQLPGRVNEKMVSDIGRTMARMHLLALQFIPSVKRSWPGTIVELTDQRISEYYTIKKNLNFLSTDDREIFEKLIKKYINLRSDFNEKDLKRGAIHGDIKYENIKFKGDALIGIFDFDDCREGYFLEDITNTLIFNFQNKQKRFISSDPTNLKAYLAAYQTEIPLSQRELEVLSFFILARIIKLPLKDISRLQTPDDRFARRIQEYFRGIKEFPELFSGTYIQDIMV